MFLLWLTAMIPQVRPPSCDSSSQTCESGIAKTWQLFVLIGAFVLMAIGANATVPSFAFGADQVNGKDISNKKKLCQVLHTELYLWFLVSSSTHSRTRVGIRIAGSIAGCVVSAIVESIRHSKAIEQGSANNPNAVLDMSAYWLFAQLVIGGIAEAFYAIGQNEFYYSQFPQSMSRIATCLPGLSMAFGNIIVGVSVKVVDRATKKGDAS